MKTDHQISPRELRKLIAELRSISLTHTNDASQALQELVETGCRFEYQQENMGGERHRVSLHVDDIPYLSNTHTALPLICSFSALPLTQQSNLVQLLEEEKVVRHLEVRLQIEREDGSRAVQVERGLALASAQASLHRTWTTISPTAQDWLAMHRNTLDLLGWSNTTLPILGTTRFVPEQLRQAAESLGSISDCLVMPFPFDHQADPKMRKRWLELWQICEEAAENLSMVSAWLRCLGSTGEYTRCRICFRHLGEGMKKNCWLHHRTAKVRVPARELHVADLYHEGWQHAAKHRLEVRALLDDVSPTAEVKAQMLQAAEHEQLAAEVTVAAAALAALLRTLLPLMEPRLQARIKRQFDANVVQANHQHLSRRGIRRDMPLTPPGKALRNLSWEGFFGDFFASAMSSSEATSFSAGKVIDIDHPLASTKEAITVQKLALDLLHLSTWISVDLSFDAYGYLDLEAVQRDVQQHTRRTGRRPTYQALATVHRATPQAIQQALSRGTTGRRRSRILSTGRRELQRMLLNPRQR